MLHIQSKVAVEDFRIKLALAVDGYVLIDFTKKICEGNEGLTQSGPAQERHVRWPFHHDRRCNPIAASASVGLGRGLGFYVVSHGGHRSAPCVMAAALAGLVHD